MKGDFRLLIPCRRPWIHILRLHMVPKLHFPSRCLHLIAWLTSFGAYHKCCRRKKTALFGHYRQLFFDISPVMEWKGCGNAWSMGEDSGRQRGFTICGEHVGRSMVRKHSRLLQCIRSPVATESLSFIDFKLSSIQDFLLFWLRQLQLRLKSKNRCLPWKVFYTRVRKSWSWKDDSFRKLRNLRLWRDYTTYFAECLLWLSAHHCSYFTAPRTNGSVQRTLLQKGKWQLSLLNVLLVLLSL